MRIFASVIIVFSGLLLFADKFFINSNFDNNYGFANSNTFVWTICQVISPLLICFFSHFRPYKITYCIPIYIYAIILYWIFNPPKDDKNYFNAYAIGSIILFVLCVFLYSKYSKKERELRKRVTLLESILDLSSRIHE
jgi:hypothetical protein